MARMGRFDGSVIVNAGILLSFARIVFVVAIRGHVDAYSARLRVLLELRPLTRTEVVGSRTGTAPRDLERIKVGR